MPTGRRIAARAGRQLKAHAMPGGQPEAAAGCVVDVVEKQVLHVHIGRLGPGVAGSQDLVGRGRKGPHPPPLVLDVPEPPRDRPWVLIWRFMLSVPGVGDVQLDERQDLRPPLLDGLGEPDNLRIRGLAVSPRARGCGSSHVRRWLEISKGEAAAPKMRRYARPVPASGPAEPQARHRVRQRGR